MKFAEDWKLGSAPLASLAAFFYYRYVHDILLRRHRWTALNTLQLVWLSLLIRNTE